MNKKQEHLKSCLILDIEKAKGKVMVCQQSKQKLS